MTRWAAVVTLAALVLVSIGSGVASASGADGYRLLGEDGSVLSFGGAADVGSLANTPMSRPVACLASTPSGGGYWEVTEDGQVFAFGDAASFGSATKLRRPIVGLAGTPSGGGYWLVASDGGVFAFGDARFAGSTGGLRLNRPVVGMAATPSGRGYWLVASDGGIFAFGDAGFFGSAGNLPLRRPIVGMAATDSGRGYRLAAADGGVFTYGDATFAGSAAGTAQSDIVGVSSAVGAGSCNATPPAEVADRLAAAGAVAAGRAGTAAVAVADATTGELLGNPASAVPMRAASIIKVVIAMATLDRAEREHGELTPSEAADLRRMIRSSDNGSTSRLWASLGGPDIIRWVRDVTGVRSTEPPAVDHEWGFSTTTAHDMAVILGALVRGRVLSPGHRALLLAEMRHVDGEQVWGVGAVAPAAAVKNGWYADGGQAAWRVHSVGVVDDRWIVVVMTTYPTGQGMGYGQETCRLVAQQVLPPR